MDRNNDISNIKYSCMQYYDQVHLDYFSAHSDELNKKPYDQYFLDRFSQSIKQNGSILDIGCCSSAQQARYFYEKGFNVTSIDLSLKCIQLAAQKFPGINFMQMDMTEMKFEKESFDGVIAFYSFIHIVDEKLDELFSNLNQIVKMFGKVGVAVYAGDFYGYFNENGTSVFYRTYNINDLKEYFEKSGFKIIDIDQRPPFYNFEFQSERIYLIAEKIN